MIRKTAIAAALLLSACGTESTDGGESPEGVADPSQNGEAWATAYDQAEIAKADGNSCSGILLPDQGDFGGRIALTFDDGPKYGTTDEIMEILKDHNAPATFFMLGTTMQANKELTKQIIDEPSFIAAHHTWTHPQLSRTSGQKLIDELDKPLALFNELGATVSMIRPPYGALDCEAKGAIDERGLTVVGWHIDSADWTYDSGNGTARWDGVPSRFKNDMTGYILHQTAKHNGGVMLFHDIKSYTAAELDGILTKLENLGYTFVGLDHVETFPRLNGLEPPFIGDACQDDADCGFTAGGKSGYCLASSVCVVDCEGTCPDAGGKPTTFCVADPRNGIEGGICVSKAVELNEFCAAAPQTEQVEAERYIGSSSSRPATAKVCMPVPVE